MAHLGTPILVDGTHGEGGGALLRTALCMAALTQQPLRVDGVRGGTAFPGLDTEDLVLLRALAESCAAETTGAELGSTSTSFLPTRRIQPLNLELGDANAKRSPNALVVLCSLLPVLSKAGAYSRLEAIGETFGNHVLGYDYFGAVTLQALRRMGAHAVPELLRAGFGRDSSGRVSLDIEPSAITGFSWEDRGRLKGLRARVSLANLSSAIAARGAGHLKLLAQHAGVPIETQIVPVSSEKPGIHLTVWAEYENALGGAAAMGSRGVKVETLAQGAFDQVLDWMRTDATVDPYLADQLLVGAVLASDGCSFKTSNLTPRFLTMVWVIKQFLPIHVTVKGPPDGPGVVTVRR